MTKNTGILLAALGGAAVAALIANYLSTPRGQELLMSASETLKDLSGKATELAKSSVEEVLQETKSTLGTVVKEKIAGKVMK